MPVMNDVGAELIEFIKSYQPEEDINAKEVKFKRSSQIYQIE